MPSIVLHMISCPVPFVVLLLPVCLGLESAMVGCLRCGPFLLHYLNCCELLSSRVLLLLMGLLFSLLVPPFLHACLITVGSLNHIMITNVPKRTGIILP